VGTGLYDEKGRMRTIKKEEEGNINKKRKEYYISKGRKRTIVRRMGGLSKKGRKRTK
jgi:hypothetical protein